MRGSRLQLINPFYHLNRLDTHLEKRQYGQVIEHSLAYGFAVTLPVAALCLLFQDTRNLETVTKLIGVGTATSLAIGTFKILNKAYNLGARIISAGYEENLT